MKSVFFWQTPLLLVLVCFLPGYGQQARPQEQQPTLRVQVDRVNVGVIVTDGTGKFVEGLRREDFHIFDNQIEQPLTDFAAIEEPAQALLLIEAGPAVYLLESGHVLAAYALLRGLSPDDRWISLRINRRPRRLSSNCALISDSAN